MTDAHAAPDHPPTPALRNADTTTRSPEAAIAPDRCSADDHADEGLTTGQAPIEISLDCDGLTDVRARIGEVLHFQGEDFVLDVQLVATELASNACNHAEAPRHLSLRHEPHSDRGPELVVEARDASPDRIPVVGISSVSPHRGNGMKIVQTLCDGWGVRLEDDSKVVWGRIPMP